MNATPDLGKDATPQDAQETHQRFARLRSLAEPKRRHRLMLITGIIAILIVSALATLVSFAPVLPWDIAFTTEFQEAQNPWISQMMYAISIFGYSPWAMYTVALATLIVGIGLGWKEGAFLLAATVGQGLINAGLKLAIGRPRPLDTAVDVFVPEHGNSFPSGHVMFYTVFFGLLAFLAWTRFPHKQLRWLVIVPALLLIALVGPARIYLGSHWLSDVIAAYLIGFILLAAAIELYLARIAPRTPHTEEGLVGEHDQAVEQAAAPLSNKR